MDRTLDAAVAVGKEQARNLAFRSLALYFYPAGSGGLPDSALWSLSNLPGTSQGELMGSEPLEIRDLEGRRLFWQWLVRLQDGRDLVVRAAADVRLGAPVVSLAASHNPSAVVADFERTRKVFPHAEAWVCFAYPRTGLLIEHSGNVFRLAELGEERVLTFRREELPLSPLGLVENPSFWHERIQRIERFWAGTDSLEEAAFRAAASEVSYLLPKMCFVYQINADYCAPATAEMILGFHGIGIDQKEIVEYMDTVLTDPAGYGGTELGQELEGYNALLGQGSAFCRGATFIAARREIGTCQQPGRPLKVGTSMHAMPAGGWRAADLDSEIGDLYVYDPDVGPKWEPFNSEFLSYVYIRP